MNPLDFLKPLIPILQRAIQINYDKKALARFVLYLLGPEERDKETASMIEKVITGGEAVEAIDGLISEAEVKNLREWANLNV